MSAAPPAAPAAGSAAAGSAAAERGAGYWRDGWTPWLSSPADDGYEYLLSQGVTSRQIDNVLLSLREAGYAPAEWSDQLLELTESDLHAMVQQADSFAEISQLLGDDDLDDDEEDAGSAGEAEDGRWSTVPAATDDDDDDDDDDQEDDHQDGCGTEGGAESGDYSAVIQMVRDASAAADPPTFADTVTMLKQATAADAAGRCMVSA